MSGLKKITVTISDEGRDNGKVFLITEMPCAQAEKWAIRVFLALARSGIDMPDDISESGMGGIASIGLRAISKMSFFDAEPLLDEMFQCVQIIPDKSRPSVVRSIIDSDIMEVKTRLLLRKDILGLHINFSMAAAQ